MLLSRFVIIQANNNYLLFDNYCAIGTVKLIQDKQNEH